MSRLGRWPVSGHVPCKGGEVRFSSVLGPLRPNAEPERPERFGNFAEPEPNASERVWPVRFAFGSRSNAFGGHMTVYIYYVMHIVRL